MGARCWLQSGVLVVEQIHLAGRWKSWPTNRLVRLNGFMPTAEYIQLELFHRFSLLLLLLLRLLLFLSRFFFLGIYLDVISASFGFIAGFLRDCCGIVARATARDTSADVFERPQLLFDAGGAIDVHDWQGSNRIGKNFSIKLFRVGLLSLSALYRTLPRSSSGFAV